jgi:hypothetical protein
MKEFMLYIRNDRDAKESLTPAEHLSFVKGCEVYIQELTAQGKMISAQPLVRDGVLISKPGEWKSEPIQPMKTVQVGYYHIRATSLEDAIDIARRNPEFQYVPSASIEVREVRVKEAETGFTYPSR